ncbi:CMP-N-acetylneuraminate-beta-galactosamide-alpha-2,3-sialyltransferase 1-like [Salarias fasciatus]|uniref:CMP-N-acetylneuraminate-beta-galactosamide- alpha-2,3-sialyltransferase 1-like n=1 Tax=Salarias fasciatus TaxID=181472 RepID=UPI001176ECCD|nr:CMP-N-acetylneuraminate-beta-galactosamide-alpha-2,3-sialyltransferase 1-like [Salarias fasciatus]
MAVALYVHHSQYNTVSFSKPEKSRVCSCPQCLTDGDPWFWELINSAPQPFLSEDYETSEDDFKWWKGVQWEKRNFTLYNATLSKLFQVIPRVPGVVGSSPDRCRTCAVVGNSGNLNGSSYGSLIDGHDIVIRMNRGLTKGYEEDVGKKTTHHVMYPQSAMRLDNSSRLVFVPFNIYDLQWIINLFSSLFHLENRAKSSNRIANKDLVMILNPAFMRYVHEAWLDKKGRYPSTGFIAVALSMQMCDEINVFGFGADRDGNWNHYFEQIKNKKLRTGPHAGNHEYTIIEELHNKEKIQFFVPQ